MVEIGEVYIEKKVMGRGQTLEGLHRYLTVT